MATASSSSFQPKSPRKFDVFISFRGEDTRTGFTSHLHAALADNSLETFIDNRLQRGDEISPSLIQAIKDSSVSIVVFSQDYASSKWCLDELAQIIQFRKDEGQFVIPIFYKVDPSDVRKQEGTYKEAFEKHERDFMHDQHKVNKWKAALSEAANFSGWHCQTFTDESDFIQKIVDDVVKKLDHMYPTTLKDVVGIDENIKPIEELVENFPRVGIWGMGGIGKTTMAKAVFAKLSSCYQSCCFLENIREESEKNGLKHVRNTLVSELLMEESIRRNPSRTLGDAFVMRRLGCKTAFIVLDDVDSLEQLEDLDKVCEWSGLGSKVIITTRNRQLLRVKDYRIHEAKGLSPDSSLQLFISKAFGSDHPEDGYEPIIKGFVDYTQHNPLALRVLGSFLRFKTKEVWDCTLRKLKKNPNEHIQEVLQLSYNGLDREEKEIFLDIACFLKGEKETFVKELLESYEFNPTSGIETLIDKALVVIKGRRVWMHDLIQEMGFEVVRQECIKKPGRRTRLWDSREIYDILKNNRGTEEVEGIMLDISQIRDLHLTANPFEKMTNLRFLKFYSHGASSRKVHILAGLDLISSKIRYFRWDGYPRKSMPSNFCTEHLIELKMEFSTVETLWEGVQDFVNLRRLKLRCSRNLRGLPDFSKARNLKSVDLACCKSLCYLHPSLLSLHSLISLNLEMCKSLKSLQSEIHLKSLKNLTISGCSSLKEFCVSSEELTYLNLNGTAIETLSPSIGRCRKLATLWLSRSKLKNLPIKELSRLRSLEQLEISDSIIDNVRSHVLLDALVSLRYLSFQDCCNLIELPNNIRQLSSLQFLDLRGCKNLQCLPKLPSSIKFLLVTDCTSLSLINCFSMLIGHLSNLKGLHLNALSLGNLPLTELCHFRCLVVLRIRKCSQEVEEAKLSVIFDALSCLEKLYLEEWPNLTELPNNIRDLSELQYLSVRDCTRLRFLPELPPSLGNLTADNCTSLEMVCTSTISNPSEKYGNKMLSFINCVKLDLRLLGAIKKQAKLLLEQAVHNNEDVKVYYPGKKVPKWFGNNQTRKDSGIVELSLAPDNLLGFIFCCVVPAFIKYVDVLYGIEEDEMTGVYILEPQDVKYSPGNVFLHCNPVVSKFILKVIEESKRNHEATTYNRKLFFKFSIGDDDYHDHFITECGVYPIYASEYHNVD